MMEAMSLTWRTVYPDWQFVLWTDEDNLALVEHRFPQWSELYRSFK